jgi:hypothetical protein
MNKRIRELAFKAANGMLRFDEDGFRLSEKEAVLFAELIVQECLLKIENERFELPDFIIDSVKEHFGVDRERGEQ